MYSDPPKVFCFKVRHFVICMTLLSISLTVCSGIKTVNREKHIVEAICLFIDAITLYGAIKVHPRALKISLWTSAFHSFLCLLGLLILPIIITSHTASGYFPMPKHSRDIAVIIDGEIATPASNFNCGLLFGYVSEALLAIYFLYCLGRYILINRMYMYATAFIKNDEMNGKEVA